ncbi:MAG TPA: GNAT family acetyltransferase [Aestuariivirgaceae bacterium]|nr:GNAT family acetyltransferase [Aestuariivirgaceae bacterium]
MADELVFRALEEHDMEAVVALWQSCGLTRQWNDPRKDINFARGKANSEILVGLSGTRVVSSIMVGHDGHRGSFYYVAVDPKFQRRGIGAATIRAGEKWLKERGVWKVNLLVRQDNMDVKAFYEELGYEVNAVMSMGQRFIEGK